MSLSTLRTWRATSIFSLSTFVSKPSRRSGGVGGRRTKDCCVFACVDSDIEIGLEM